jgi:hypothetical protein
MTRRIVCWLTDDPASAVAAKLAIRENESVGMPLVAVTVGSRVKPWLASTMHYIGVPVVCCPDAQTWRYKRPGDVHVIGVPVDEQGRWDRLQEQWAGALLLSNLADRGLTRADCLELWSRSNHPRCRGFMRRSALQWRFGE